MGVQSTLNVSIITQEKKKQPVASPFVKFVKSGAKSSARSCKATGLLDRARDWVILADIGSVELIFPPFIYPTSERPDIAVYSLSTKRVIIIENTSGCEENQADNHNFKTGKYEDLVESIQNNGWSCHFYAIEVGARGYNSTSVPFCLKSLGFPPRQVREILRKFSQTALKASFCIWLARANKEWKPDPVEWKPGAQNRSSASGAREIRGLSPAAICETSLPVTGPSDTPSVPCPPATIRFSKLFARPMTGSPSGVQGRIPCHVRMGSNSFIAGRYLRAARRIAPTRR